MFKVERIVAFSEHEKRQNSQKQANDDDNKHGLTCTELKGHCFVLVSGYVC